MLVIQYTNSANAEGNGTEWFSIDLGTTRELTTIWGTSSTDIFIGVGGSDGVIFHYDGSAWTTFETDTETYFRSIWGTSTSDLFALGSIAPPIPVSNQMSGGTYLDSLPSGGIIWHYDGSNWEVLSSGTSLLSDIWGSSPNDVFAVGTGGTILHYNGTGWNSMESGTNAWLNAIWGSSSHDVYAVGTRTIIHYNGSGWSEVCNTHNIAEDIWGSSPTDIYAVGSEGTVVHYNGTAWSPMDSGTRELLRSIWGSSPTDIYAVGIKGTIIHYNGTVWTEISSGVTSNLRCVFGTSNENVLIAGDSGTVLCSLPVYPDYPIIQQKGLSIWSWVGIGVAIFIALGATFWLLVQRLRRH